MKQLLFIFLLTLLAQPALASRVFDFKSQSEVAGTMVTKEHNAPRFIKHSSAATYYYFGMEENVIQVNDCGKTVERLMDAVVEPLRKFLLDYALACMPLSDEESAVIYYVAAESPNDQSDAELKTIVDSINGQEIYGMSIEIHIGTDVQDNGHIVVSDTLNGSPLREVTFERSEKLYSQFRNFINSENKTMQGNSFVNITNHISSLVGEDALYYLLKELTPRGTIHIMHTPIFQLENGATIVSQVTTGNFRDCSNARTPCAE